MVQNKEARFMANSVSNSLKARCS